ncbi:MAG: ABC-ATPase domain-containing protein [bacterium]|nr:ABC-ATPase domain-containing protein [bacterium]
MTGEELEGALLRIDGHGYKAYKAIAGCYALDDGLTLFVDHVQGDPFAAPSKLRVRVDAARARLPALGDTDVRRIAFEDYLARRVADAVERRPRGGRGSGRSGEMSIDAGGQIVLQRTSVVLTDDWVEARIYVGLPGDGRRVLGRQAAEILCRTLPRIALGALCADSFEEDAARRFVDCVDNQEGLREQLAARGLVAFVGDGAVLPRASGASDRPLDRERAVPFVTPEALRVALRLRNPLATDAGTVDELHGMAIPEGVTLIVGGGYHGKSTLLQALEHGVYPHVPGDGREQVVTRGDAVKVRAEDGRHVASVHIRPFICDLPLGRGTDEFSTDDASGSTSQAASIVEALEVGSRLLLLDEDTSATNFMVRDARMQALVSKRHEPITPFIDRVRELYERHGVSTVLVMGGCGDYLDVADHVILMRDYEPHDETQAARRVAAEHGTGRRSEAPAPMELPASRAPDARSFDASRGRREVKIDARGIDRIEFGTQSIDLRGIEQIRVTSQTRAIAHAIHLASKRFMGGGATLREIVDALDALFDREGLDLLDPYHAPGRHPGSFARPRRYEIAAVVNRLRTLRTRRPG